MNNLTIEVYSSGTTRIADPANDLAKAQGIHFATGYPGGLYLDGSLYIPRDVLAYLPIKANYRVVFRNGMKIVYEGWVDGEVGIFNETDQGIEIPLVGAWGRYLMRLYARKIWADNRVSDDVWGYNPTPAGKAYCDVARLTDSGPALLFNPSNLAWGSAQYAQTIYTMPVGRTVAQVTCNYRLVTEAAAPNWGLYVVNGVSGAIIGTVATRTTAGSTGGAYSGTLGTPINSFGFRFRSGTSQTPSGDGSSYGEVSSLLVFDTTSAINLTNIAKNRIPADFNSDESHIDTIADTGYGRGTADGIVPLIFDRWVTIADMLTHAASFGDDNFDKWAVGCLHSEMASTPDGEPVLFAEKQPVLTNYDYAVSVGDENLAAPFGIERDYTEIWNNIIVEYRDENGFYAEINANDGTHIALEDTTSQTDYGQRDYLLNVGNSTADAAYNSGQRFLAAYKDPQYKLNGAITVNEYIRKKDGSRLPASEIQAGKRVKIENYLQDLSGTGLTFLISHTEYDDTSETCSIQTGLPDDLIFPTFEFESVGMAPGAGEGSAESGGTGSAGNLNWKRKVGLTPGTPEWDEAVRIGKKAWYAKYKNKVI